MAHQAENHRWRFVRAGNVDQVRLERGADVAALERLDLKTWVALACPVKGLEFDERTLALLDADGDGRIRAPELVAGARWACGVLKDPDVLIKGVSEVPLAWIDETSPDGAKLLAAARHMLCGLGKADADVVSVADAVDAEKALAAARLNGDGIQPPAAQDDPALKALAADVVACLGGEPGHDGELGVSQAALDRFFELCTAYREWASKPAGDPGVLSLGDRTAAAAEAVLKVQAKIDDYFTRVRLAAFDARALGAMNRHEDDWKVLAGQELAPGAAGIAAFPLARVEPDRPLPLTSGLNPAWVEAMTAFREAAVEPTVGKGKAMLTAVEWAEIKAKVAGYGAWVAAKAGAEVEKLGEARLAELAAATEVRAGLAAAIAADAAVQAEVAAVVEVERLTRYARDLHTLLTNTVAFTDFYARKKAVFQAGTLFLDGRACDLCLKVTDPGKHALLAGHSKMYLVYCDCTRPGGQKMSIVAAMTNGDSDNLMVGRNGVFYDRQNQDWDATVTKIVENPISLRQAFFAPYKKFLRLVEDMIAKRAAAADAAADQKMASAAEATASADQAKPPATPKKIDIGTVAAIGVAVGGITAALGALLSAFFGLGFWMPIGVLGLILLISGPSMLIAWLKLRKRNIGPLLDASGWAVNALARINTPFGAALTTCGRLPPGSERTVDRTFADKKRKWPLVVLLLVLLGALAWVLHDQGTLGRWLGYAKPVPAASAPAPAPAAPAAPAPAPAPTTAG